ncbi:DUF2804 domain-containing protein [Fervidicella metallireducens]|uniref:DUF2804 domain-containing protein n=1 Tax=Fervidicella metallireducens TaxID=655338 RepID=UPI0006864ADC|nr:DUF2804 domain-containing protein [Fervidicella metallireducens]
MKKNLMNDTLPRDFFSENILTSPTNLCDSKGDLLIESVGWSRSPLHRCNLKGKYFRKKQFTYWNIFNEDYLFNVTIMDFDYIGIISFYLLNLKTWTHIEKIKKIPFAFGVKLPDSVDGSLIFKDNDTNIRIETCGDLIKFNIHIHKFLKSPLTTDIMVQRPNNQETLNIVIPWDKKRFHFTSKQNCLSSNGTINLGGENIIFEPDNSFASMDFGRGIWPYNTFWTWCSASGKLEKGEKVGFNLGAGWTDNTGLNENALFIGNKLIKIQEDVSFIYDSANIMEQWSIKTKFSDNVNLKFTPHKLKNLQLIFF